MQTCDRTQEVTGISRSHQCKLEQWNPKPIYRITPHITCHSVAPDTSITLFKCITTRCTHHRLHTRATDLEEQVQFDITNTLLLHFSKSTSLVHNKNQKSITKKQCTLCHICLYMKNSTDTIRFNSAFIVDCLDGKYWTQYGLYAEHTESIQNAKA
jgi:hypothetical protein